MTVDPLPSDFGALTPCLDLAGVSRRDLILVAGPGALPAMLWLCRHGYQKAMHLGSAAPRGVEVADALTSILSSARCVREEGVLILRTSTGAAVGPAELLAAGWGLQRRLTENGHAVLVARRPAACRLDDLRRSAA